MMGRGDRRQPGQDLYEAGSLSDRNIVVRISAHLDLKENRGTHFVECDVRACDRGGGLRSDRDLS